MFVILPILSYVLRHAVEAWRQYCRDAAIRRELECLDDRALRDLGLSHRCAVASGFVDRGSSLDASGPLYRRAGWAADLCHCQGAPEDRTSQ